MKQTNSMLGFLDINRIKINDSATSKSEVLKNIASIFSDIGDANLIYEGFVKREEDISTGLGMGIAIPHARGEYIKKSAIAFFKTKKKIDFQALDNKKVNIFIAIVVPVDAAIKHLEILSIIAKNLSSAEYVKKLKKVNTKEEAYILLSEDMGI